MENVGQRISVDANGISDQAKIVGNTGTDLQTSASQITALIMGSDGGGRDDPGPTSVFGAVAPEAVTLGTKFNQILSELALLGTTLGNSLTQSAGALQSAAANYSATENAISGK